MKMFHFEWTNKTRQANRSFIFPVGCIMKLLNNATEEANKNQKARNCTQEPKEAISRG